MSNKSQGISFTEKDWQKLIEDYTAWWHGELDRPLIRCYGEKSGFVPEKKLHVFLTEYGQEIPADEIVSAVEEHLSGRLFYADAFPSFLPNFGPGIMAAFTGMANPHTSPDTVWFKPEENKPLSEIRVKAPRDNLWFRRVKDITEAAVERFGHMVQVGHTDLGGNLDILAALRTTENLLLDLVDCPEEVKRVLWDVHDAWWIYYLELEQGIRRKCRGTMPWACTWAPGRTYMLQCDFAAMISPEMFALFVLPELQASCKKLEFSFYHLDGPGQLPHLDLLLDVPELDGIQWVPGEGQAPSHTWTEVIRKIRDAGKLVQLYTGCEGTLSVLREFGGKGFVFDVTDSLTPEGAAEFLAGVQEVSNVG